MELMEVQAEDKVRKGYKRTELGVIPADWVVVPLGALGAFSKGQGIKRDQIQASGLPCVRYGELYTAHNDVVRGFRSFISKNVAALSQRMRRGDLLFAGSGETKEEIGKCAAFLDDEEAYAGGDIVILSLMKGDPEFFGYLMNAPVIVRQKASMGQGDAVVHISAASLSKVLVPLPPLPEQRAIATALSDADALLGGLEALIAKKQAIKQGAMQALLTPPGQPGHKRLPEFKGEWVETILGSVADLSPGINKPLSEMGTGALYVTVQDLYQGTSIHLEKLGRMRVTPSEIDSKALTAGDIVFGKSSVKREGIGYPSQFLGASEPVICSGFTYRVRANSRKAIAGYLFYCLRWDLTRRWLIDNSQASALTNINKSIAHSIPINLPSMKEQAAIATVLTDMDAELLGLEQQLAKLRLVKQGMMQELLTGRKRLV